MYKLCNELSYKVTGGKKYLLGMLEVSSLLQ